MTEDVYRKPTYEELEARIDEMEDRINDLRAECERFEGDMDESAQKFMDCLLSLSNQQPLKREVSDDYPPEEVSDD